MENPNPTIPHSTQLSSQRYNHQIPPAMWNNKVSQGASSQNTSMDPYSQQMNHYYQAQYPSQGNDVNRYASKDQNSNPAYPQYPMSRQTPYSSTVHSQNYQMSMKANCNNNMYYNNANPTKNYAQNNVVQSPKKYVNSNLGLPQALPTVPQSPQIVRNTGTPMPQMPQYGDHTNYSMQNAFASNYNVHTNSETEQSYMLQPTIASPSTALTSQENLIHSASLATSNQVSQMSSIPTPPETSSSLPSDGLSTVDNTPHDSSSDTLKMNISNSSFVLPGSVISHMPSSASSVTNNATISNRNTGNSLVPPANLDEGSQASSASASSSIPDEQNSVKTNSKPNFSYPPTPNTLSSPGAASMSSFHDDLECISSPGWPKTPASPVANGNYEFTNIKRPDNLLKLYTLSDEPDRRYFLDKLIVFSEDRGSPISQCPTISKQPLDVYRVYLTVKERGGFVEVTNSKRWKDIAGAIGVGASSSAAYTLRKQYMKLLLPFECKFDRGGMDPQPIINMVEATSRKKGKSSPTGSYGNQIYHQPVDPRYPPGYQGTYPPSRYQGNTNSMDYQSATNSMHYPQASGNNAPGQSQYNQYSQSSPSNYRYYPGSNSTGNAGYNNNMPNNSSDNGYRFGRSATSTPVPQDQGYYSQQFSSTQPGQSMYNSNRECSIPENPAMAVTNNVNSLEQLTPFATANSSVDTLSAKSENISLSKPNADNFETDDMEVSIIGSTMGTSQENKTTLNNNYGVPSKTASVDQNVAAKHFSGSTVTQPYQQFMSESALIKTPEPSFYSNSTPSSYATHNQAGYLNQAQSSYTSQKLPYQGDFQSKEQMQPNQYGRYSEAQNEPYRGSAGSPAPQVMKNLTSMEGITSKTYKFNSSVPYKGNTYAYAAQQGQNKEAFNHPSYSNQFVNRPQRTWHPEQNPHSYQQLGPRPHLKNHMNSHELKPATESPRLRRAWVSFQNSAPNHNKNISASNATQMQSFHQNKTQPQMIAPAAPFQSMIKKPLEFPPNTIEAIRPVAVKRRRCPAKRLGSMDPWRLMLALKSGLLAECTWALDAISILLADNSTVVYFNLAHLPGLLNVLVDHHRCYLNKIFNLAKDMELGNACDQDNDSITKNPQPDSKDLFNIEEKTTLLNTFNYTYKTRCQKKVELQYDEALFLIDPQRSWDIYENCETSGEHWEKGGGDITSHIQTCFAEETKKVKFNRDLESKTGKNVDAKSKNKLNLSKSSLLFQGEPVVVLKKFNINEKQVNKFLGLNSEINSKDMLPASLTSDVEEKMDVSDKENNPKNCPENENTGSNNDLKCNGNSIKSVDGKNETSSKNDIATFIAAPFEISSDKISLKTTEETCVKSTDKANANISDEVVVNSTDRTSEISSEVCIKSTENSTEVSSKELQLKSTDSSSEFNSDETCVKSIENSENISSKEILTNKFNEASSDELGAKPTISSDIPDSTNHVKCDDSQIKGNSNTSEKIADVPKTNLETAIKCNESLLELSCGTDSIGIADSSDIKNFNEEGSKLPSPALNSNEPELYTKCDIDEISIKEFKTEDCDEIKEIEKSGVVNKKGSPQIRGSLSSRKRFLCEVLEDEAYCFDQPALCVITDSQEMLSRRCVCVSTIIRNLSFVPGNDIIISKNPGVLVLLGRLLLLHHEHQPAKSAYHKYEKEVDANTSWIESCTSLKDEHEWWWSTLKVLRDNTLVILSNISGQLDLSPFPEEVSLPILDGLLHWAICPSSYAQDPLPSRSPSSVLSPQRLCLETLCKLSVLSDNVDLIIATPPWSRIENLFLLLTKSLCSGQDQIMREFALILLSNISQADSAAARTIAEQNCCIAYLIAFIEEAEANAFQIASSQGTKQLRDKPELMGTTPGMVQRAANTLKNLALVPENRVLFMKYQPQLLNLVMSQVMDQELAAIIADVLFYCSDDVMGDISNRFRVS
ncbi:hypothetical protein JTE90_010480 [Oedothorax gibbosus]|uniref:ARID domain-containing protein n=1 Tax=Oedothorax gibbosus TaxID=931172 RepID=A0AAV6W5X9_9ARAC|nr:hypothetical protein JTE90_010480 [Oedothorax gibbosus]